MTTSYADLGKARASLGVNQLVEDPDYSYLDDLQTQRKRLHYPCTMTKTSSEFSRLVAPATAYTRGFFNPRTNTTSVPPARNNKDTPYNGNWTIKKLEPSSIPTPAGMRIPK